MHDFLVANMAPIMFASLIMFLMFGYAVTFSLAACGLFFGLVAIQLGVIQPTFLQSLPLRMFGIMQNDTLLAIPFFTFMGLILERSGMAEDLLDTIGQLFGPIRGGLAYAVILVGAMLAATTGVVAASVISMGLISLPIMLRYGYDRRVAGGVIAASGTLAQIIPPSLVLIVLADQLGKSVGDLYKGAFIPGFVLTALYIGYILVISFWRPQWVPALPAEARTIREDDGTSGLRSLSVLVAASVIAAVAFAKSRPDVDVCGRGRGVFCGGHQQAGQTGVAVAHGRTRHLCDDSTAGADLFGAGHDLFGHCHTHRRRCHGFCGRAHHGHCPQAYRLEVDPPGDGFNHEVVMLRALHFDWCHGVQPGLSGCGRAQMGGASADGPARRAARLFDRRQHSGLCAGLLSGLL
jgi:Tripartite ATP-independent periplasmic transporter, DctM component